MTSISNLFTSSVMYMLKAFHRGATCLLRQFPRKRIMCWLQNSFSRMAPLLPMFLTVLEQSHKKSPSDFRSHWKSPTVNLKSKSVFFYRLAITYHQNWFNKKSKGSMIIISTKFWLSKLVLRTWGSAPLPLRYWFFFIEWHVAVINMLADWIATHFMIDFVLTRM